MAAENSSTSAGSTTSVPAAPSLSATSSQSAPASEGATPAGWATHQNNAGGFSIAYPSGYSSNDKVIISGTGETDIYPASNPSAPLVVVNYSSAAGQTAQSAFDTITSEIPLIRQRFPSVVVATSTASIGSFSAQVLTTSGSGQDDAAYVFEAGNAIYQVSMNYDAGGAANVSSNKTLADSILATFQLISSSAGTTSNSSWQSYTDSQFGITFPYPPGYWVQSSIADAGSEDITVRPSDVPQLSGIELMKLSITPAGTDSVQSEVAQWTSNLQYGRYTFATSTATIAGYSAQRFSLSKPDDNGALYIFTNGKSIFVVSAYYDNASSAPNSSSVEATNESMANKIIAGIVLN